MPRKFSKRTLRKNRKNRRKTRKHHKIKKNYRRGGNGDTKCCMCGKPVDINNRQNTLIPSGCLLQHGQRAHRICKECWFKPVIGFGIEGTTHKCPGCEKGLPLTIVPYKEPEMVDLSLDDD